MRKNNRTLWAIGLVICVVLLTACGSSNEAASEPEPVKALEFSSMKVETEARTGFLWGRFASFEVKGSVTNNTDNPINADNLPVLIWDDEELEAEMSQEKLLEGETCKVSWKEELTVEGSDIPELSFNGSIEYVGLDECQKELNDQLQAIAEDYAAEDSAYEEELKAEEKEREEAKKKKEDEKAALTDCKGKTAIEAKKVAESTEYQAKFVDDYDVDVTSEIKEDSEAGLATVSDVAISEGFLFSGPNVTFKLDYTDPVAKKEREAEAAEKKAEEEEAAKRQAEEEAAAKKEAEEDEWVKSLPERPLIEVLDEVEDKGLGYSITIYPSGSDVTDTLTREDLEDIGFVVMDASRIGYVSKYSESKLKEGDIDIRAVDPTYWKNEKELEETLPFYKAERALDKYAKEMGMKSVEPWYKEAVDASTWYIKGDVKVNGTRCTFEAKVTGTESSPIVLSFDY